MKQALGKPMMRSGMAAVRAAALCLGALAGAAHSHAQCQYSVTVLPTTGCFGGAGTPTAINNLGEVIITGSNCAEPSLHRSYIWTGGITVQPIQSPPGWHGAFVEDLNDLHEMVGYAQRQVSGPTGTVTIQEACLWQNGVATLLGIPKGGNFSVATGINNRSEVCGYWGNNITGPMRAFIWRDGLMQDLDLPMGPNSVANDINDVGQITGWMGDSWIFNAHAFVWSQRSVLDLGAIPRGVSAEGNGVGPQGEVAGYGYLESTKPFGRRAVHWIAGIPTVIPPLPGLRFCLALDTNGPATVGYCFNYPTPEDGAFLYQNNDVYDLTNLTTGATVAYARAINALGQIVARGNAGGTITMLLTPMLTPPGDVTRDCVVDVDDLVSVIHEWGREFSYADADQNGVVDVDDLVVVILDWTV